MALRKRRDETEALVDPEEALAEIRRAADWAERRLAWTRRLDREQRTLLETRPGERVDKKAIHRELDKARAAWASEQPPEGWESPLEGPELLPFDDVVTLNGGARVRQRTYRAGETDPNTGEPVPDGQTVTALEDLGLEYAKALRAQAQAEAAPPAPEPERPAAPTREYTPEEQSNLIQAALGMPAGILGGDYRTGGERRPREVGVIKGVD